ncbi:hypothetical protein SSPO_016490 [Streptomyces antimycoticus]|uniref:Fe/B12 periplasmic-binding domain-containing protein n=1 Tax=Streptomyces antimycoticus TaxID=68175 RepID=A0A499UP56_9ACTN|nr:hypothetical protein SSPO_016490 [Streptomyces antimycoticus]
MTTASLRYVPAEVRTSVRPPRSVRPEGAVRAGHTVTVDGDPWYLNAGPTAARVVLRDITERLGR